MITCLICCEAAASVFCCNDDASLCKPCSVKVHSANRVAARHTILPFCAVCNAAAPTVFCRNDDAFLCAACDAEAHTGLLASRHERIPAASASKEGANKIGEDVVAESSSGANSEVAGAKQQPEQANELTDLVSLGTDFGVVPVFNPPTTEQQPQQQQEQMQQQQPQTQQAEPKEEPADKQPFGKDFDFDIDAAWLDRLDMGFDFSDILGDHGLPELPSDDAGLVPTMSASFPKDEPLSVPSTSAAFQEPAMPAGFLSTAPEAGPSGFIIPTVPEPRAAAAAQAEAEAAGAAEVPVMAKQAPPARKRKASRRVYQDDSDDEFVGYDDEEEEEEEEDISDDDFDMPASKSRKHSRGPPSRSNTQPNLGGGGAVMAVCAASGLFFQMPAAVVPVSPEQAAANRAERIAKCREKRKSRKFEKTIRYATRKAYAEVRPRIKGRFVKKEELDAYYATHGRPSAHNAAEVEA